MHMCTANNTRAHSHFPFSLCLPLSFAHILWGIYGDVKAVIGQVSGVELSDNRLVTVAAHEWGMERRRGTEGIETLNSLLNQKVNWKSWEFRLPAERDRGGRGAEGKTSKWERDREWQREEDRGNVNGHGAEIKIKKGRAYYHSQGARCLFLHL